MKLQKNYFKYYFVCFLVFSFFGFSVTQCSAAQTIEIYPALYHLKYVPGTSAVKGLAIKNWSREPAIFKIRLLPLNPTENFGFENLRSWVSFEDTVIFSPYSEKELKILINIPKYAAPQGYYGQLLLEPMINDGSQNSLQIIPVFAVPLLLDVVSLEKNAESSLSLQNMELQGNIRSQILKFIFNKLFRVPAAHAAGPVVLTEKSPLTFKVAFKNTGKLLGRFRGKLSIATIKGEKITETDFAETLLLPNEAKTINVKSDLPTDKLAAFIFPQRLRATVETGNLRQELIFWAFSWKKLLLTIAVIFLLMIFFCVKNRLKKAVKILFNTNTSVTNYK